MTASYEITDLLIDWGNGNELALDQLLPLVEAELKKLARYQLRDFKHGNTLQTAALINETYMLLIKQNQVDWKNRAHFFGIAAKMMRRILLNYLRDNHRIKRGGEYLKVPISEANIFSMDKAAEFIALDEALKLLALKDERKAKVVELKFFGGLNVEEIAEVLKISPATVIRDWTFAKAWLKREIRNDN